MFKFKFHQRKNRKEIKNNDLDETYMYGQVKPRPHQRIYDGDVLKLLQFRIRLGLGHALLDDDDVMLQGVGARCFPQDRGLGLGRDPGRGPRGVWNGIHHFSDVIMSTIASQITSLTIVYSNVYSGADQRKHQSSASLAFVRGIHWWPVNSPHKGPVTRRMFPFDNVIMIYLNILYPCLRNLYWETWNIFTFSFISQHGVGVGISNSSSWKTRKKRLSCIVNIADDLATQGVMALVAFVLI